MSRSQRDKGKRIEREIVALHEEIGVHAERVPLSGASHYRDDGHDVDIYAFGRDEAPWVAEVKGRKSGEGFAMLERWLADYDLLVLRRDRKPPLVLLPWRSYRQLMRRKPWQGTSPHADKEPPPDATSDAPGGLVPGGDVVKLKDLRDGKTQTKTHGAGPGLTQRKAGKA